MVFLYYGDIILSNHGARLERAAKKKRGGGWVV